MIHACSGFLSYRVVLSCHSLLLQIWEFLSQRHHNELLKTPLLLFSWQGDLLLRTFYSIMGSIRGHRCLAHCLQAIGTHNFWLEAVLPSFCSLWDTFSFASAALGADPVLLGACVPAPGSTHPLIPKANYTCPAQPSSPLPDLGTSRGKNLFTPNFKKALKLKNSISTRTRRSKYPGITWAGDQESPAIGGKRFGNEGANQHFNTYLGEQPVASYIIRKCLIRGKK